jgi:hypothetical protein
MDGSNGGSPGRSIVPDTIKERGLWYASEVYARLPEKLARRIAQSQIRRGNRFEEGEEFLLHALKVVSRT